VSGARLPRVTTPDRRRPHRRWAVRPPAGQDVHRRTGVLGRIAGCRP